ncbi:MAG: hypothetical protein ACREP1_13215, partial [Rhodanobacteraceae bacterium]
MGLAFLANLEGGAPATPGEDPHFQGHATKVRRSSPLQVAALGSPGTTPARLHLILPSNFASAWQRRQIMVCAELEIGGRRLMLDALPADLKPGYGQVDRGNLEQLTISLGAAPAGMNILPTIAFLDLLPLLRGFERLTFGRSQPARVAEESYRPRLKLDAHFTITAECEPNDTFLVAGTEAWLLRGETFFEIGRDLPARLTNALQTPLRIESQDEFLAFDLPLWLEIVDITLPEEMKLPAVAVAQPEFTLKLEGSLQQLRASLSCRYGNRPPFFPTAEPEKNFVVRDENNPDQLLLRNLAAEQVAVRRVEAAG